MNNSISGLLLMLVDLLGATLGGVVISIVFFYTLWLTVQQGSVSSHPLRWFLGGFLLRMSVAVSGFYLVGQGQWQSFVACLLGFILGRLLFGRLRLKPSNQAMQLKEAAEGKEMHRAIKSR